MNFSLTYRGVAILLVGYILRATGQDMPDEEVANFVATLFAIVGAIITLYGRYKAGGVTWHGVKK